MTSNQETSNRCKKVLDAPKLAYADKTKESITSQKLGSCDILQIANSVLNKGKSAIPPIFNGPEVCLLLWIKKSCLSIRYLLTCFPLRS